MVDALDHALDYERELSMLSSHDKSVVDKLWSLVEAQNCAFSKKCKRTGFLNVIIYSMLSLFAGAKLPAVGSNAGNGQQKVTQKPATIKENASYEQRIEILNWYHANGENQTKMAKHFDAIYLNL